MEASRIKPSFFPCSSEASTASGMFSGSGAIADIINAGGPPRKTFTGRGRCISLRFVVMKAYATLNLEMHSGGGIIKDLVPIHADVGFSG